MTPGGSISPHWRALHAERLEEAVAVLGAVSGVRGLVLGGSVARGEHWPLSDIDILPIWKSGAIDDDAMSRAQAQMVDWWAASGRAQTLDVSWLRFDDAEVVTALKSGPELAAHRMSDLRWFHGLDKMYGGRGVADPDGVAGDFVAWATDVRFEPEVVAARSRHWRSVVADERDRAVAARVDGRLDRSTLHLREAAGALRLVLLESWGKRLSSMGREWTIWERAAREHGAEDLAIELADVAAASPKGALERAAEAPIWLQERIALAFAGRLEVGESVTEAESARDQIAAYAVHVPKRRKPPFAPWLRIPEPDLSDRLARLDATIEWAHEFEGALPPM